MPVIEIHVDQKIQIREWFEKCCQSVTGPQMLLALDYIKNYGYSLDVACPLALESYKMHKDSRGKTNRG
jgi:hypothetical protein